MTNDYAERLRKIWGDTDYTPLATGETSVSEGLVHAVDVHGGERVLDVAGGTGNTAISAARRHAVVTVSDIAPANLERALSRAGAEGLTMTAEVADAQALPFDDDSFDVVLSTFGVMYAPDHKQTAAELLRVCRPGGRIGLVNWPSGGLFEALGKAFATSFPPPPAAPTGPPPTMWSDEQYVQNLFGERIKEFTATPRRYEFIHTSARAMAEKFRDHLPPFRAIYRTLNPELQWRTLNAVTEVFERFNRCTDGTVAAQADYLEIVATVA